MLGKKLKAWSFLRDKHATGLEKDRIHIPGETWTFREHWRSACCVRAVVRIRSSRSLRAVPSFHRRDPEARWPNVVSLFELRPAVMQTTAGYRGFRGAKARGRLYHALTEHSVRQVLSLKLACPCPVFSRPSSSFAQEVPSSIFLAPACPPMAPRMPPPSTI